MPLLTPPLAKICAGIRDHVETTIPSVGVTIGAPGANLTATNTDNTLNLFFYRFEPFGFAVDALPGDVQWVKVFCVVTAFGVDEDIDDDSNVDFSAGFNDLRMLAQVMRMFQEEPALSLNKDGETWHIQFIPRPLGDEQINQIWSTQGDTVYRPSIVYEISLVPIEPETSTPQVARVVSVGAYAGADNATKHMPLPSERETHFYLPPSVTVDISNPQWAPTIVVVDGSSGDRQVHFTYKLEVSGASSIPDIEIFVAGDTGREVHIVGQLLQGGKWLDIDTHNDMQPDAKVLDVSTLPDSVNFTLGQPDWTGLDERESSWQLQLFAERQLKFDSQTAQWLDVESGEDIDLRIRSNPVLISVTERGI